MQYPQEKRGGDCHISKGHIRYTGGSAQMGVSGKHLVFVWVGHNAFGIGCFTCETHLVDVE